MILILYNQAHLAKNQKQLRFTNKPTKINKKMTMTTPKQAQEAALLAMIKQLLPEQEILESEIETIYAAVDYIRELSAMLE